MNKLVLLWSVILAKSASSFVLRGMLQPNDDDDDGWPIDTYDDIIWTISTTGLSGKQVTTSSFEKVNSSVCKNESLSIKRFSLVNQSAEEIETDYVTNQESFIFKRKLNIYGNQTFLKPGYKYAYPIILGICLSTMLLFVLVLVNQLMRSSSMGQATLLILIAIAIADVLTLVFSLSEIGYLYSKTSKNSGYLPLGACNTMFILERLSAVPHAASVWFTVVLAIQRYLCVANPFSARRTINVRVSLVCITIISVFIVLLHSFRFFDTVFVKAMVQDISSAYTAIETCQSKYAEWVQDPVLYETIFVWVRIAIAQLIPSIVIVMFVFLMVKSLMKSDFILKETRVDSSRYQRQRRQLSVIVSVIALIVVVVEVSSGVFLSLYAWETTTGTAILSKQSFQLVAITFDIVLYVSYFAIFIIYCLMAKQMRKMLVSFCIRCHEARHNEVITSSYIVSS